MKQKDFGQTGTMIPEIGQGTWGYTAGPDLLRRGVELGACLIDTAEAYGNEDLVGRAVKDLRDRVFLATKVSPRHFMYSKVLKSADQSLHLLNTDYIDLYQMHFPDVRTSIEETLRALDDVVRSGKARYIGCSNYAGWQVVEAQWVAKSEHLAPFISAQNQYNLLDRRIER